MSDEERHRDLHAQASALSRASRWKDLIAFLVDHEDELDRRWIRAKGSRPVDRAFLAARHAVAAREPHSLAVVYDLPGRDSAVLADALGVVYGSGAHAVDDADALAALDLEALHAARLPQVIHLVGPDALSTPPDTPWLTMLPEPVGSFVDRATRDGGSAATIDTVIADARSRGRRNPTACRLAILHPDFADQEHPLGAAAQLPGEQLQRMADEVLRERFTVVGIDDEFDASYVAIGAELGLRAMPDAVRSPPTRPRDMASVAQRRQIEALHEVDSALHAVWRERFAERFDRVRTLLAPPARRTPKRPTRVVPERLRWTPTTGIHPAYRKRIPERAAVQKTAHRVVAAQLQAHGLEHHHCPICHGDEYEPVAETERNGLPFPTAMCACCGLVQAEPRPPQSFYDEFYARHYRPLYEGAEEIVTEAQWRDRASRRPARFVDWVHRQPVFADRIGADDLVVEVGCSAGMVASKFADRGYRVIGLDLDATFMDIGIRLGYDLRVGKLSSLADDEAPAAIYYHHVFEHISEAENELEECARRLPIGGLLVMAVPGLHHIDQAYDSDLLGYLQIAHVYDFSLASLSMLAMQFGFRLVTGNESVRAIFERVDERVDPSPFFRVERESCRWRLDRLEQQYEAAHAG